MCKSGKWLGFRPVVLGKGLEISFQIWERADWEIGCIRRGGKIWGTDHLRVKMGVGRLETHS